MGLFGKFRKGENQGVKPLVPYKAEFKTTCVEWLNESISHIQAHDIFQRLHQEVYQLAYVTGKIPTQAGYDFFNLASEMAKATEFENQDRSIAFDAIALVDYHLGQMQGASQWDAIMNRCSGIQRIKLCSCQVCGLVWPLVYGNPFSSTPFAFCLKCGDLFGTNSWDSRLYEILCAPIGTDRDTMVESTGILLHPCSCGGNLAFCHETTCPGCGDDLIETSIESPYNYMQSRKIHLLDKFIVRRVSLKTEGLQGELQSARDNLLEALGQILAILEQNHIERESTEIKNIANSICEDLQRGLDQLFKYYTAGFASVVITADKITTLDSHDMLNVNIKFRSLRSDIFRQANKLKYLLKHWKQ